jgi:hypothetical protein
MAPSTPPVLLTPRTSPCHAVTSWHSESALLVCSFDYPAEVPRSPATVADRIEASLGITTRAPRVLLGDLELAWRDERRLESIELRTGRGQWEPASLAPAAAVEQASMSLELDCDVNGVASVDVDVRVLWDERRSCIALRLGPETSDGRWAAIADSVHVRIAGDQTLSEIRFGDLRLE